MFINQEVKLKQEVEYFCRCSVQKRACIKDTDDFSVCFVLFLHVSAETITYSKQTSSCIHPVFNITVTIE